MLFCISLTLWSYFSFNSGQYWTRTPDNQVWNLTFFQLNYLRFIAPGDRIELPTFTLTVYCSTN